MNNFNLPEDIKPSLYKTRTTDQKNEKTTGKRKSTDIFETHINNCNIIPEQLSPKRKIQKITHLTVDCNMQEQYISNYFCDCLPLDQESIKTLPSKEKVYIYNNLTRMINPFLITFGNIQETLEFAEIYNYPQLIKNCTFFIFNEIYKNFDKKFDFSDARIPELINLFESIICFRSISPEVYEKLESSIKVRTEILSVCLLILDSEAKTDEIVDTTTSIISIYDYINLNKLKSYYRPAYDSLIKNHSLLNFGLSLDLIDYDGKTDSKIDSDKQTTFWERKKGFKKVKINSKTPHFKEVRKAKIDNLRLSIERSYKKKPCKLKLNTTPFTTLTNTIYNFNHKLLNYLESSSIHHRSFARNKLKCNATFEWNLNFYDKTITPSQIVDFYKEIKNQLTEFKNFYQFEGHINFSIEKIFDENHNSYDNEKIVCEPNYILNKNRTFSFQKKEEHNIKILDLFKHFSQINISSDQVFYIGTTKFLKNNVLIPTSGIYIDKQGDTIAKVIRYNNHYILKKIKTFNKTKHKIISIKNKMKVIKYQIWRNAITRKSLPESSIEVDRQTGSSYCIPFRNAATYHLDNEYQNLTQQLITTSEEIKSCNNKLLSQLHQYKIINLRFQRVISENSETHKNIVITPSNSKLKNIEFENIIPSEKKHTPTMAFNGESIIVEAVGGKASTYSLMKSYENDLFNIYESKDSKQILYFKSSGWVFRQKSQKGRHFFFSIDKTNSQSLPNFMEVSIEFGNDKKSITATLGTEKNKKHFYKKIVITPNLIKQYDGRIPPSHDFSGILTLEDRVEKQAICKVGSFSGDILDGPGAVYFLNEPTGNIITLEMVSKNAEKLYEGNFKQNEFTGKCYQNSGGRHLLENGLFSIENSTEFPIFTLLEGGKRYTRYKWENGHYGSSEFIFGQFGKVLQNEAPPSLYYGNQTHLDGPIIAINGGVFGHSTEKKRNSYSLFYSSNILQQLHNVKMEDYEKIYDSHYSEEEKELKVTCQSRLERVICKKIFRAENPHLATNLLAWSWKSIRE